MTSDDQSDRPDELDLLRQEARELGMPGEITPEAVGVTLRSPDQILSNATRQSAVNAADVSRTVPLRSWGKGLKRVGAVAAALVAVGAAVFAPWERNHAMAEVPPILEYQFADMRTIADAPGKDARAVLMELSSQAAKQPEEAAEGAHQYVLTESWYANFADSEPGELVPSRREQWLRADRSMQIREAFGHPLDMEGRGLSITEKTDPIDVHVETYPAEEGHLDPQFLTKLSGRHKEVKAALIERGGCLGKYARSPLGECIYMQIGQIYATYVVPPRVAAAFWRILADDRSLRSLGTVEDRAGRPGIGISLIAEPDRYSRQVLIISSETGQLLGSEEILIKDNPGLNYYKAPALTSFSAILESRFTTKDGPAD